MSADTDHRDQPDVQHRAMASDADTPGRPDATESDRRAKMQAALHGAATRAGAVGRYLWAELRATTMATASQTWRLVCYGIASARLSMSRRTLRRAHLALGEKLYQVGSGDPAMRDAIRGLDEQIKAASEVKRSTSKLVAQRREQLIQLAESSASASDVSPAVPERERMLTCWQDLEQQRGRLEALRIRLWPSSAAEAKRVVLGTGMCLLVLIAVFMLATGHKPNTKSSMDDTYTKLLAGGKEAAVDGAARPDTVRSAAETSNAQMPTQKTKSNIPSMAVAPFDSAQAKQHQQSWASYLGVPVETINSIGMELVLIPPGEFLMGSPDSETEAEEYEKPQHRVRITKPFYLGVYEVTQSQYQKVMGENPSKLKGESLPVETISWEDAMEFCKRLSEVTEENAAGRTYRLPTDAEWEYACRAGTTTQWYHGNDENGLAKVANVADATLKDESPDSKNTIRATDGYVFTAPVGQFQANAFGLYDMHGNVREWCQDWLGTYEKGTASDPTGPGSASSRRGPFAPGCVSPRVLRGGSFFDGRNCRSASRTGAFPDYRCAAVGFRVAGVQSVPMPSVSN